MLDTYYLDYGESQGRGSLAGCRLWDHTEVDTTEVTWQQQHLSAASFGSGPSSFSNQVIPRERSCAYLTLFLQPLFIG